LKLIGIELGQPAILANENGLWIGCELSGKCGFARSNLSADEVKRADPGLDGQSLSSMSEVHSSISF
jgi:hypothetical protein